MNNRPFSGSSDEFFPAPAWSNRMSDPRLGREWAAGIDLGADLGDEPAASEGRLSYADDFAAGLGLPGSLALTEPLDLAGSLIDLNVDFPYELTLPERFEPTYAYPLVVWFHGTGGSEAELAEVMAQISDQNYVGLALRGDVVSHGGWDWPTHDFGLRNTLAQVHRAIDALNISCRIHDERVYLAGWGTGGTMATQLLLSDPNRFAGAANLLGEFPQITRPLSGMRLLRGKRMLLSMQLGRNASPLADVVAAGHTLYNGGVQVGTRIYQAGKKNGTSRILRDVDRWIMEGIHTAVGTPP